MKKFYIMIIIFISSFLYFLYVIITPKNYTVKYDVNSFEVTEAYVNESEVYHYYININNKIFPVIVDKKYNRTRKHVSFIEVKEFKETICAEIKIDDKSNIICYQDENLIDFRLSGKEVLSVYSSHTKTINDKVIGEYNKVKIYNYDSADYYIWNYKGYDLISKENNKSFNYLKEDEYNNILGYKQNQFLITPNYDSNYYFNQLKILNTDKKTLSNFNLGYDISYSSFFLGNFKNSIYLIDKKNKIQYKINLLKKTIQESGNEEDGVYIKKNNKLILSSYNKVIKENHQFKESTKYNYELHENKLYYMVKNYKILVSNLKVKYIVDIIEDNVYYISGDFLYCYSPNKGEIRLLQNNEWNFNFGNNIFVFTK